MNMKKQYHVISAKNFGYESVLGDGTYGFLFFLLTNTANTRLWALLQKLQKKH